MAFLRARIWYRLQRKRVRFLLVVTLLVLFGLCFRLNAKVTLQTTNTVTRSYSAGSKLETETSNNEHQRTVERRRDLEEGSPANLLKNIQVLLYNRVPKSGGESMIYLIHKISKQNGFNSTSSMVFNKRKLNAKNQKAFIEEMLKIKPPFVYDRHIYFTDFTKFDYPNPLYINIIREPVEKMISRFFFWRMPNIHVYEELKVAGKVKMDKQTWLKKDFKECVLKSDPECTFISGQPYDLTIPYFCGHEDECMILNSEWALEKAKENVEKYYSVVGVLEQMDITIKVMEAYLPQFFRGLFKVHKKTGIVNKTSKKDKVPRRIKEMLKRNLKTEYEFYNFIIDRLHKQYRTLKLKKHQ